MNVTSEDGLRPRQGPVICMSCNVSSERKTSKASIFPVLPDPDLSANLPEMQTRDPWVYLKRLDPDGLSLDQLSMAKFMAVVLILTMAATLLMGST